jgi:hypothetical protein
VSQSRNELRDMFAAHAMQALLLDKRSTEGAEPEDIADLAYEQADAMLKARSERAA